MGFFSRLFRRDKKVESKVESEETVKDANDTIVGINNDFVYEEGELTTYDCIEKARKLGLDMRSINDTLRGMSNKEFVVWFKKNHLDKEDE